MNALDDTDFAMWAKGQAELLRMRAVGRIENEAELDWSNIAEEIDSLAKSDRRELKSLIVTILQHLILLRASPATDPRGGWERTIVRQRAQLHDLLDDNASLVGELADVIAAALPTARKLVASALAEYNEQPKVALAAITFTADEVLTEDQ